MRLELGINSSSMLRAPREGGREGGTSRVIVKGNLAEKE
jgi:hypothetical protein